jgi:hypothetical protein
VGGQKRHKELTDFVRLFWLHRKKIKEYMPKPHPINKYKNHAQRGLLISTGELCEIFTLSKKIQAKKFFFVFGMDRYNEANFNEMMRMFKKHGKKDVAKELRKRKNWRFIDLQFSTNLLSYKPDRDVSNYSNYSDSHLFYPNFQFLSGGAKGYEVDWVLLEKAIDNLNKSPESVGIKRGKSAQRKAVKKTDQRIDDFSHLLSKTSEFDPKSRVDARKKVEQSIAIRRGQTLFRNTLLKAYGKKCAITECIAVEALEAAHILPYKGEQWNHPSNGILLRADIHVLFDLHLISIDPKTYKVAVSSRLQNTNYGSLNGKKIVIPESKVIGPNKEALSDHFKRLR